MSNHFHDPCIHCGAEPSSDVLIHHILFGTRYFVPDKLTPDILRMQRLVELCEPCLNQSCPSELLATVLKRVAFDRLVLPCDQFEVISDSFTVECDTCNHPIPDRAPFFTVEHSVGLAQFDAGRISHGDSAHLMRPKCYLAVCPNCEAQIDVIDAALEAIEISMEIVSRFRFAANDPVYGSPDIES